MAKFRPLIFGITLREKVYEPTPDVFKEQSIIIRELLTSLGTRFTIAK